MSLGLAGIFALLALWIAIRMNRTPPRLPPPKPDERDSITTFKRMNQP